MRFLKLLVERLRPVRKYPPEVSLTLREAGWREGRRWEPERLEAFMAASDLPYPPAVVRVLSEFGGLNVGRSGRIIFFGHREEWLCASHKFLRTLVGEPLFPIGWTNLFEDDGLCVLMDESGRIYVDGPTGNAPPLDYLLGLIETDIDRFITRMFSGARAPEKQSWYYSKSDFGRDPRQPDDSPVIMNTNAEPLADAAFSGDLAAVKRLIALGADINAEGRVWNPLHAAIENDQIGVVRYLIRAGADLESLSSKVQIPGTPLEHAVDLIIDSAMQQGIPIEKRSKLLIDLLVAAGARIEPGLETARHYHCAAIEEYLRERAKSPLDAESPIIAGRVELPDARAAAFILERAGWSVRKAGWDEFEICGEDYEIYIQAEAPVLIHGPSDHPEKLVRKLAKTFADEGVRYSFEVYDSSGELKEIITNAEPPS
jgi:hypothetical protein